MEDNKEMPEATTDYAQEFNKWCNSVGINSFIS